MGKQKQVEESITRELIEALPSGQWVLPNLHEWAAVFGLHYTQGSAAMRRALDLSPVRRHGEVAVDNRFGCVIARAYVLGYKDDTRVYWMRAPAYTTAAEVVASVSEALKVQAFLSSTEPVAPRPAPAPGWGGSLQPGKTGRPTEAGPLFSPVKTNGGVSLAKPAVEAVATDAELMRELDLRREAVRTAEATLALEQRRLQEVAERLRARVSLLQAALRKVHAYGAVAPKEG